MSREPLFARMPWPMVIAWPSLSPAAKAVAGALLLWMDREWRCRPSQAEIARQAGGMSARSVKRALSELRARGLVSVERHGPRGSNYGFIAKGAMGGTYPGTKGAMGDTYPGREGAMGGTYPGEEGATGGTYPSPKGATQRPEKGPTPAPPLYTPRLNQIHEPESAPQESSPCREMVDCEAELAWAHCESIRRALAPWRVFAPRDLLRHQGAIFGLTRREVPLVRILALAYQYARDGRFADGTPIVSPVDAAVATLARDPSGLPREDVWLEVTSAHKRLGAGIGNPAGRTLAERCGEPSRLADIAREMEALG